MNNKYFIGLLWLFFITSINAAPITFNTALPISQGEWIWRLQYVQIQSKDSSQLQRNRQEELIASTFVYGVSPKLALFATLGYSDRTFSAFSSAPRQAKGLIDSKLLARYTLYQKDFLAGSFRIAPFVGVKLATARDDLQDQNGRLPKPVQLGSGSQDWTGGIVTTYATSSWGIDAQISYLDAGQSNQFSKGDRFSADFAFQYPLFKPSNKNGEADFFDLQLEFNYRDQAQSTTAGLSDINSGGVTLLVAPGLQYITRNLIIESSVQLPIQQDLNGQALEMDSIFRLGFRTNF
ncbi:MAG: hypothetical protein Q9M92_13085 [Enterobacterales bacterium]|nr:hypothetical protein [Enterobacterales bacterium]